MNIQERNRLYKLRYRVVRNYTGNSALARKLRSWSNEHIYEEYGIRITKTIPKLKTVTPKQKSKAQDEIIKYRIALQEGYTPKGARQVKRKSIKVLTEPQTKTILDNYFLSDRKDRKRKWIEWSRKNKAEMPSTIDKLAQDVNRSERDINSRRFDIYAHYGYTVVYYAYILNKPLDEVRKYIIPNRQEAGEVNFYATLEAL